MASLEAKVSSEIIEELRDLARSTVARQKKSANAARDLTDDQWHAHVQPQRKRRESIASILDSTLGPLEDYPPQFWERRAYWLLVGVVYERLAVNEKELPTEELVKLAKVLAENRRAELRSRDETPADSPSPGGELPEQFSDVVRQIYGTNFQSSAENVGVSNPGAPGRKVKTEECDTAVHGEAGGEVR